jgi:predicted NAD/FAD-binding protein
VPAISDLRLNSPVSRVSRDQHGVIITSPAGEERFDSVIFATHAPQTLAMLADASQEEREILSAVRYQPNTAVLHGDARLLPKRRKTWSAWNFLAETGQPSQRAVCVSYLLNALQPLPVRQPVIVTLNPLRDPEASLEYARFVYEHPLFDSAAIAAQARLPLLQGKRNSWFAGAWTGYGFHEDGLKSALRVAADFVSLPDWARHEGARHECLSGQRQRDAPAAAPCTPPLHLPGVCRAPAAICAGADQPPLVRWIAGGH